MPVTARYVVQCFVPTPAGGLVLGKRIEARTKAQARLMTPRLVPTMAGAAAFYIVSDDDKPRTVHLLSAAGEVPDVDTMGEMMIG